MLQVVLAGQALVHDCHAQREVTPSNQAWQLPCTDLPHRHLLALTGVHAPAAVTGGQTATEA